MTASLRYAIHVPKVHRGVLAGLADVPDDEFERLLSAIRGEDLTTSLADLQGRLDGLSTTLDTVRLLEALLGASSARIWRNAPSGEVAAAVAEHPDLDVTEDGRLTLGGRLEQLLETESLEVMAKGLDVLTEHERIFLRSRIVTDIRPAYRPADTAGPAAAVITHTLRMEIQESGEIKSIYIAMDESDLRQLQAVIEREIDKTHGLKAEMNDWGLVLLNLDEDGSIEGEVGSDEGP